MIKTSRNLALNVLIESERSETFTNLALKKHLRDIDSQTDKKFISALVYTVIENKSLLDYYISKFSSVKLKKINRVVLNILRLGACQIIFMDTPESAACNTSVDLAKNNGQYKSAGFVNAILRRIVKEYENIELPSKDSIEYYKIKYSVSEPILNKLADSLGFENLEGFFESGINADDSIYASVNLKLIDSDSLIDLFKIENVDACKTEYNGLVKISGGIDIEKSELYKKGYYHIVGLPSYITAMTVCKANKGDTIFDMCSAPGGKTFSVAYNSSDDSKIYAFDIHEHKIKGLKDNCRRLFIKNVFPILSDGTEFNKEYFNTADTILCDVPCSGLGMIFKKPDIKYKTINFESIVNTQFQILTNASKYLKKGGKLIYSTCTVNTSENIGMINKFLAANPEFKIDNSFEIYDGNFGSYQFIPSSKFSDGFYVAVLSKFN